MSSEENILSAVDVHREFKTVEARLHVLRGITFDIQRDEVVAVTREVITERMGMQLGKVEVRIKHVPYQDEV